MVEVAGEQYSSGEKIPGRMLKAIRSRRVVTPEGERAASVVFENGRIVAVEDAGAELGAAQVEDVGDWRLLPGLVDSHVHVNEPGRSEWEGFRTVTRAAAAGGCTCLVDMPLNSIPATTCVAALEEKRRAAAGACVVDYAFWGGVVPGNAEELIPLARAGVKGFKCFLVDSGVAEFAHVGERELREAMRSIAQTGLPLLVHAEHPEEIVPARGDEDGRDYAVYLRSRPPEAERRAIELVIRLSREFACRVHIVHVASAEAMEAVRRARADGLPVSAETCPHYLYFAAEEIQAGATQFKCAPPIRESWQREQLWEGLREGTIELVATDHSPCPPAMKRMDGGDFFGAWGGIASLSLALPVVWTAARRRGFAIADVALWMAEKTAELAGLDGRKGRIAKGYDADFAVFDPDEQFVVSETDLYFRHAVTPYLGERLEGRVKATFVRGNPVFRGGEFANAGTGRECRVNEWTTAL